MSKKTLSLLLLLGAGLATLLTLRPGTSYSQQAQEVWVTNFPSQQEVTGTIEVEGPIRSANLSTREDVVVSPTRRVDTGSMVDRGTLEADGFTHITLSLYGEVKDTVFTAGKVGVLLVPDQPRIQSALDEGHIHLQLEVTAKTDPKVGSYFSSSSTRLPLAFPRYRILFYNSSSKSVEANLYAYLTN